MKIAIIGAGMAGLSCARHLIKRGIRPDIFEKQNSLGSMHNHVCTMLRLFTRGFYDPLKQLARRYEIKLHPLCRLTRIIMQSPGRTVHIRNKKLGYVFSRGDAEISLEHQLAKGLDLNISFDTWADVSQLRNKYDFVIVATGDGSVAKKLGIWNVKMTVRSRVATVLGNFKPGMIKMWINTEYTGHCYAYLLTESSKKANLVLNLQNATEGELESRWKAFLLGAELNYKIIETCDSQYSLGYPDCLQYENILFTGNAAGLTDDFLGMGVANALESGALVARAITDGLDYAGLVKPIIKDVSRLHQHRIALNTMDNAAFDRLLGLINLPFIKQLIYGNPFFRIKHTSSVVKAYNGLLDKT